jgi:tetratricopeptide (TPR) repeat protein
MESKENVIMNWSYKEDLFKKLFIGLSFLLLIGMPILSFDFGITGDELVHKQNGENVLKYLQSGGVDTTYRTYKNLYLYGALFDASAAMVYENMPKSDPYTIRHFLNSLFGAGLMIFTGLLARQLSRSWLVAFLAMLLTVLSPRIFGDSMNNPKDIPFALAYVMSILGIIRFNSFLPKWNWKAAIFLGLSMSMALNIRVGGLLLMAYFGLYTLTNLYIKRKEFKDSGLNIIALLGKSIALGIVSFFLGLIFFPYSHSAPITNTLSALKVMSNFDVAIRMLFEGRALWSDEIPWYYIPKWLSMAIPISVLVGFVLFFIRLKSIVKTNAWLPIAFVGFVGIFPVVYAVYKHSSLYDGIRHFMFLMPMINVLAAMGWAMLIFSFFKSKFKWVVPALLGILLLLPLRFMIAAHPNEYIYFNELSGGIKKAYGEYETDYWMNSMKELSLWLIKNDERIKKGEQVIVCTNSIDPVKHYFERYAPNVKVLYASFKNRYKQKADYYLSIPRFIDSDLIKNGSWPPQELIHSVKVDGVMVGALSKYMDTLTYAGLNSLKTMNLNQAKQYFLGAVTRDSKNEIALTELINSYINMDSLAQANVWADKGLALAPNYEDFLLAKGLILIRQGNIRGAYDYIDQCKKLNKRNVTAFFYSAMIMDNQKNYSAALDDLQRVIEQAPNFKQAYLLGAQIMQNSGNPDAAAKYMQYANQLK